MATRLSVNQVRSLYDKISNWGRWGKEDQRGALNFITPERRAAAARLVQSGEIVSLSLPLSTQSGPDNPQPVQHMMLHAWSARLCFTRLFRDSAAWDGVYASRRALSCVLGGQDV